MPDIVPQPDFHEVVDLIRRSKEAALRAVNVELVKLYYEIGSIVSAKVNGTWGEGTVDQLAGYIELNVPDIKGFTRRGIYRMMQFYETYSPDSECFALWLRTQKTNVEIVPPVASQSQLIQNTENIIVPPTATQLQSVENKEDVIVSPVARQLDVGDGQHDQFVSALLTQISWTNHLEILSGTKSAEEKLFYLLLAAKERLSKRELRRQINSAVFERTMIGNQKLSTVLKETHPDITNSIKDSYILEFLNLPEQHNESDLQKALIQQLRQFILELGKDFLFVGDNYRLQVSNTDFFIDLLFYHRSLRCFVVFELKTEKFKPEFIGQLNFYLEALDRDVRRENENPSIGILLCKVKEDTVVEYALARSLSPAVIADYQTKLPDKKLLAAKLEEFSRMLAETESDQ